MEGSINKVEKVIIEVGSTNTKIDLYNGQEVKRMEAKYIIPTNISMVYGIIENI